MTAQRIERRIRKLEGARAEQGFTELTSDELEVLILELATFVMDCETADAEARSRACETVARIEAHIIDTAFRQAQADYAPNLEWCSRMWRKRTGKDDYEMALLYGNGFGEYNDWEKPDLMARRRELRAKPFIQKLLSRVPEKQDQEQE